MDKAQRIRISKLSAARRQLDCAIELWFAENDEVSTHTLAGAAHQIIHDIHEKRCGGELLFNSLIINDEHRKEFVKLIRKDMNFFKHADQDPDGITEFAPIGTMLFIVFSIAGLQQLGEKLNSTEIIFCHWLALHHPNWVNAAYRNQLERRIPFQQFHEIRNLGKAEFFQTFLSAFADVRH